MLPNGGGSQQGLWPARIATTAAAPPAPTTTHTTGNPFFFCGAAAGAGVGHPDSNKKAPPFPAGPLLKADG